METLKIADKTFTSRLFTGTGKFSSNQMMEEAIIASESQLVDRSHETDPDGR